MRDLLIKSLGRLFSTMGIYVTMFVLFMVSTLIVTTEASVGISRAYTGAETLRHILIGMSNMVYLKLPLAILVSGAMFADSTFQKELTSKFSRTKIYLSHLVLSSALGIIFTVTFTVWSVALSTSLRGLGSISQGFWLEMFSIFGVQIIILLALSALATFLVYAFKRTSIVVGMYFALLIAPRLMNMRELDIAYNMVLTAQVPTLYLYQIFQILSLGAGIIVFTTLFGIMLFKLSAYKLNAIAIVHMIYCLVAYVLKNLVFGKPQQNQAL
ncbi:MAG: hypothetical protein FWB88_06005 [Defluviitaleaceae bacterium]|nr:hypothetical protein [Defluviitaleaceae bacterium]MCL2240144.1 hypothetical protein [Defluviitaleaceae bacterium]